jgi:hypothetical protein
MLVGFLASLLLAAPVCQLKRDDNGRIVRDKNQVTIFKETVPCPRTGKVGGDCHGYVVDHICPLSCCGKDDPSNMQWQTTAAAKAKDAWEWNCSTCTMDNRALSGGRPPSKPAKPSATSPLSVPRQPSIPAASDPASPGPASCCKHCTNGCPCGDSCISCKKECRKPTRMRMLSRAAYLAVGDDGARKGPEA